MSEIIFFDVDGTLMAHHGYQISNATIHALHQLKKAGHLLCIATGRSYDSLKKTPMLDLIEWNGILCNNGQLVLNEKQDILFKATISPSTVKEFLHIARNCNYPVVVKCQNRFLSQEADQNVIDVHHYFHNEIPPVGTYSNQEVEAMNIYAPKDYDYRDFKHIQDLDIIPGDLAYAEVSVKGVNKASSINYLLEYYNHSSYIAFGDSPNDIKMLEQARISVAMGQSEDKVKQAATFVTLPLDQEGIDYACKQLSLYLEGGKL